MKKLLAVLIPVVIAVVAVIGFMKGDVTSEDALTKVKSAISGSDDTENNTGEDAPTIDEAISAVKSLIKKEAEETAGDVQDLKEEALEAENEAEALASEAEDALEEATNIDAKAQAISTEAEEIKETVQEKVDAATADINEKRDDMTDSVNDAVDSVTSSMDALKNTAEGN